MLKKIFTKIFPANSFDTDLRYRHVIHILKNIGFNDRDTLLEVGSGSRGITRYLKREVTGIDKKFEDPSSPLLKQIITSATRLPFKDKSFDFTVCLDVIEHISPKERFMAIEEMIRVTRKMIILALPTGNRSLAQDKQTQQTYFDTYGNYNEALKDHLRYSYPQESEICQYLDRLSLKTKNHFDYRIEKNTNLTIRNLYMSLIFSKTPLLRKLSWLIVPFSLLWFLFNFGSCYRKIFIIPFRD